VDRINNNNNNNNILYSLEDYIGGECTENEKVLLSAFSSLV
jgi:hypothetical protein